MELFFLFIHYFLFMVQVFLLKPLQSFETSKHGYSFGENVNETYQVCICIFFSY